MIQLFPFQDRATFPMLSGMTPEQRAALPPGTVTHVEWVSILAFGRTVRRLNVWYLGCRKPLVYRGGTWR